MNIREMQDEILRLKKEKDICILAHAYQGQEICEIADHVGDSYSLSKKAALTPQKNLLMCGVRFMAETCKILSPDKRVILSHPKASCPMAEQIDPAAIAEYRKAHPNTAVVVYINSTAELKTVSDVCVTSSSAVKITGAIENRDILFIPDQNLASWVKRFCPDKNIHVMDGGCPVHSQLTVEDVQAARKAHPEAKLLVHPECIGQVCDDADYVGSTTGIMDQVRKSPEREFIIGTENSIVEHLQMECPDKKIYELSKQCICHDMRLTTLSDIYEIVKNGGGQEIELSESVRLGAKRCLDRMLELGE